MRPEIRWSQLHKIDDRLLDMAAAAEALAALEAADAKRLAPEPDPLPDEPVEDEPVLTRGDVEEVVLEVLADLLGVSI